MFRGGTKLSFRDWNRRNFLHQGRFSSTVLTCKCSSITEGYAEAEATKLGLFPAGYKMPLFRVILPATQLNTTKKTFIETVSVFRKAK